MTSENRPEVWCIEQAAVFIKKSTRWIQDAMSKPVDEPGSIPFRKIGKKPVFFPEALAEWIALGCPPAAVVKAPAFLKRKG